MAELNHFNGNWEFVRRREGYGISNITSDVALSVKGIKSVTTELYGQDKTLKDVFGENMSSEYKTNLLLKISHCLLRLKNNQTPLDELSPSEIFIREKELAYESNKDLDIGTLAKLFYQVLTGRDLSKVAYQHLVSDNIEKVGELISEKDCDDPFTAQDLIEQMISKAGFTIKDVLLHPLFWSEQDKIIYICNIYDRIVPECKIENKPVLKNPTKDTAERYKIDVNVYSIIPVSGWIQKLELTKKEIHKWEKKNPKKTGLVLKPDIICGCAIKIDRKPSCAIKIDIVKSDINPSCQIEIKKSDENPSSSIKIVEEMYNNETSCALNIEMGNSDENISCPITVEIEKSGTKINCAIKIDKKPSTPIKKNKEEIAMFDNDSIFELIRFFRIHHAHYWEKNLLIREAFGDYNAGYWNFYQRRFPKLLIHVYRAVKGRFDNDKLSKNRAPFKYLE